MAEGFPDFRKLKSQLLTSGVQQTNNALWQVIDQLLVNLSKLEALIDAAGSSSGGGTAAGTITGAESSPIWREQEFDDHPIGIPGPQGLQGLIGPMGPPGDLAGGLVEEAAYDSAATPLGINSIGGFTPGSVIFAGTGGTLSQDNARLFWNRTLFRFGIGLNNPSNLLDVFGAGTDIGYVARFTENNTAGSTYLQIRSPAGNANAQAGFTCIQQQNSVEWRFAVIGNEGNAFRISGGNPTINVMYCSVNGNVIIDNAITDPAVGSKCLVIGDGTAPGAPDANTAIIYADDIAGTVNLFAKNEASQVSRLTGFINGSVIFAASNGFSEDNTNFFWDDTNNRLGLRLNTGLLSNLVINIGSAAEEALDTSTVHLHLQGDFDGSSGGVGHLLMDGFGAQPIFSMRRANGTQAAKTALLNTNLVFNLRAIGYDGAAYAARGFIRVVANENWSGTNQGLDFVILLNPAGSAAAAVERLRLTGNGDLTIDRQYGYQTGAGGSVTQITNKATAVTLNNCIGRITLNNAALAADAIVSFTLNNTFITDANALIFLNHCSGGTGGAYLLQAFPTGAGTATIFVTNISTGSLSEAIVIQFEVKIYA